MKVVVTLINLLIAALFFSVVYSAANVYVQFDVGAVRGGSFTLNGDEMVTAVPVHIHNGGIYPVSDVHVLFTMSNGSRTVYSHTFTIKQIPALGDYDRTFLLGVNLSDVYSRLGAGAILNGGRLKMNILITGHYWYMATFTAVYSRSISWGPLVYSFIIYRNELSIENGILRVPYFISKIPVPVNASIDAVLMDDGTRISSVHQSIVFDHKEYILLPVGNEIPYLLTHADTLTLHYSLHIFSCTISGVEQVSWAPPLENMRFSEVSVNGTPYMALEFRNADDTPYHVSVNATVYMDSARKSLSETIFVRAGARAVLPIAPMTSSLRGVSVQITVDELNESMCMSVGEVTP